METNVALLGRAAGLSQKEGCQFFILSSSMDDLLHTAEHGYT